MEQEDTLLPAKDPARSLSGLAQVRSASNATRSLPPVHLWDPPLCAGSDFLIKRDGSWHYKGSPVRRAELVRLFSTILRKDEDGQHYLVTPVEKCRCEIEDAPFLAVHLLAEGEKQAQTLRIETNVGDVATIGPENPIRFETEPKTDGLKPYVLVRANLEALVSRALLFDLVELATTERHNEEEIFGIWSCGTFWPLSPAAGACQS